MYSAEKENKNRAWKKGFFTLLLTKFEPLMQIILPNFDLQIKELHRIPASELEKTFIWGQNHAISPLLFLLLLGHVLKLLIRFP